MQSSNRAASARTQAIPARRLYRIDSWLSEADANFLLKKKAIWSAKQGEYETAIALFNRLISLEPNTAEHYVNRGLVLAQNRQDDKAIADYNRALELDNTLDKAYNNRANLHAKRQDWADAISDYDEAIDLNPLNTRARLNQAVTFREMGNAKEALTCLDIALFFDAQSAAIYAERGRAYHVLGHWNCAIADYRTALELTETTLDKNANKKIARRVKRWMASLSD